MARNPFICDCNLHWLAEYLHSHPIETSGARCDSPRRMRRKKIAHIRHSKFKCKGMLITHICHSKFKCKGMLITHICHSKFKCKGMLITHIWLRPTKSGPVGLKKLTFHTFHHVEYNGCFKHMNYRLSMSNKPCHTIFFSFRMVGLQSWVLRVSKSSRFLRYPQDTSHFLCFYHVQINTYNLL